MSLITMKEAEREGAKRFGICTPKYYDFMQSWLGLARKGKFGRECYLNQFGKGRRSKICK